MWIVRAALKRPYTIAVVAIFILMMGFLSIKSMLIDIFPTIDIPVVGVVWNYPGLSAEDMERRVVLIFERALSTTVGGIESTESDSIPGTGVIRIYFQRGSDIGSAIAQINSVSGTILRILPPGMQAPAIIQYNAANLPVLQLQMTSDSVPEQKIFDYGLNFVRVRLFTIPGLSVAAPYGGMNRQINVDVDPELLLARGLSAQDVVTSLQQSNIILPAGIARIGDYEYDVTINSSPRQIDEFSQIPIRVVGRQPLTIGDVARVTDSHADQTNIVRVDGQRGTYLNILRKSNASTLDVVNSVRDILPLIKATSPPELKYKLAFDQSVFVKAAVSSVIREAVLAAFLVSMMILLFLNSWRSVIMVSTSIPLAIMASIIGLRLTDNSLNIMTLGGLSLAIGMLVDDATVEVENIHRNRAHIASLTVAVLTSARQVALPAIMSTLSICVVFFPVVLLTGPARFLFTPLALSVVFAMLASYLLSRTLVPVLARMLMTKENPNHHKETWFTLRFAKLQTSYERSLETVLKNRKLSFGIFLGFFLITLYLPFIVGTDFFPSTDAGIMKLHFRSASGMRIEETEKKIAEVESHIRKIIPAEELSSLSSMIGVPTFYNLAFVPTDNAASMDAEVYISLGEKHHPTVEYQKRIRSDLELNFPGSIIYFQPADIVSQVLNFGVSAPIDVQIEGQNIEKSLQYAQILRESLNKIPGLVDVSIRQIFDYPTLHLNVDRERAAELGLTQINVANTMLVSLSSSALVAPSYYLNPENSVNYPVVVKVPISKIDNVDSLLSSPVTPTASSAILKADQPPSPMALPSSPTQRLGNLANMSTMNSLNLITHSNVQRTVDVRGSAEGRDLGSVTADIQRAVHQLGELPAGTKITLRGQSQVMHTAFARMGLGILLAIALVYLLMVVLFQSWLDPFIIMVAVPGALIGILWMLVLTGTTINVESLMGSIMGIGIATANSILLVSFANEFRVTESVSPFQAALEAGRTRLRPVIMTALALILGMLPMAAGLGEGGSQNAPLGRAVIGGLIVATQVTLFIVPLIYTVLRTKEPTKHLEDKRYREEVKGSAFDESR